MPLHDQLNVFPPTLFFHKHGAVRLLSPTEKDMTVNSRGGQKYNPVGAFTYHISGVTIGLPTNSQYRVKFATFTFLTYCPSCFTTTFKMTKFYVQQGRACPRKQTFVTAGTHQTENHFHVQEQFGDYRGEHRKGSVSNPCTHTIVLTGYQFQ